MKVQSLCPQPSENFLFNKHKTSTRQEVINFLFLYYTANKMPSRSWSPAATPRHKKEYDRKFNSFYSLCKKINLSPRPIRFLWSGSQAFVCQTTQKRYGKPCWLILYLPLRL